MGDVYKFGCEHCGYKTKELQVGFGMMGPEYDWSAAPCYKCKTIRTFNIAQDEVRCKRCKTELELYDFYGKKSDDHEDSPSPERQPLENSKIKEMGWYENVDFPCPKCRKPMLRIAFFGNWD